MTKGLRLLLAAALLAQSAAPVFAASVEAFQFTSTPVNAPRTLQLSDQRVQFFGELDLHLAGLERVYDPANLASLTNYLNANLPVAGATPAQLAARQVLVGALAHPELRADVEGTLRFAARGSKSEQAAAVAERLASLTRRVEAADPRGDRAGALASLQSALYGSAPGAPRNVVGGHLDALFDGTPPLAEGAPVYQKPGAAKDEFGRTNGWEDVPAEPADAPKSFKEISLELPPGAKKTSSPEDWRDQVFYYVMIDRFGRVEAPTTWGDQYDARTRHGGSIKGLIKKLDYIKGVATTIVVSPIVMNTPAAYHGYSPIHRTAVEPSIGTMRDIQTLREEAEKRGMHIIVDRVFNQTGPILKYKGGFKYSETPKEVEEIKYPLKPSEYVERVDEHFSRRGDINDWNSDEQKQNGDLPGGIPRLRSENPPTQDLLLKETKWWMMKTGEVGARVDALPHLAPSFLERLFAETRQYARQVLGLKNYFYLGELFEGDPHKYIPWLKEGRLDAAYNYISYYWNDQALHGRAPTSVLEGSFHRLGDILGSEVHRLVNFLGNHDRLHFLGPNDNVGVLHFALSYIFTSIGMPYLYGEEQAPRRVPGRKWLDIEAAREDRFPGGKFTNPASVDHSFDTSSDGYRLVSKLKSIRDAHAALRRGEQYVRWSDPTGPGLFAFSRIHAGEEVLVVLNSSGETKSAEMWVDAGLTPPGTELVDAMDGRTTITTHGNDGGSRVAVEVPAYGTRIFVRKPAR